MKSIIALVSAGAAFAAFASQAHAFTSARIDAPESIHSSIAVVCTRDPQGWFYMRGNHRVSCRPVRPSGSAWVWHTEGGRSGWWHRKEHRWND